MDCIFCKIANEEIPNYNLYEDDIVKIFLDIHPDSDGHMLIITKKHFVDLEDVDLETLKHINKSAKDMYKLLQKKLNCDGLTIVQNSGIAEDVKHYHMHIIPKYNEGNTYSNNKINLKDVKSIFDVLTN